MTTPTDEESLLASGRGDRGAFALLVQRHHRAVVILPAADFRNLYHDASVGLSLFALLFVGAVYLLRSPPPDLAGPFRAPGYSGMPAIVMAATVFVAVFAFVQWQTPSLCDLGSTLAGVPLYHLWSSVRRRGET